MLASSIFQFEKKRKTKEIQFYETQDKHTFNLYKKNIIHLYLIKQLDDVGEFEI